VYAENLLRLIDRSACSLPVLALVVIRVESPMNSRFTSSSGAKSSRKRKRRFLGELDLVKHKARSTEGGLQRSKLIMSKANSAFRSNSHSGGANNMMSYASIEMMVGRLGEARRFTRDSVFVDFGCSAGGVCLYIAQRFGCPCYGIEKEHEPLRLANDAARKCGLSKLCSFIEADFTSPQFVDGWLERIGATHVFVYDKVFSKRSWDVLFTLIERGPSLVGASCAVKKGCKLPETFEKIGDTTKSAMLMGGKSGYALQVWRKVNDQGKKLLAN
jgi:hypothetical protein